MENNNGYPSFIKTDELTAIEKELYLTILNFAQEKGLRLKDSILIVSGVLANLVAYSHEGYESDLLVTNSGIITTPQKRLEEAERLLQMAIGAFEHNHAINWGELDEFLKETVFENPKGDEDEENSL